MKLSVRGEYALRALLVLGLRYGEPVVRIQAISDDQNIPKRFLEQILNDLRSGGFVQSKRGVSGGYRLARPPEEIALAAVVRRVAVRGVAGMSPQIPPRPRRRRIRLLAIVFFSVSGIAFVACGLGLRQRVFL